MVGDRLWGSLPAADKAQPPSLPTDASSVAQMLDDLLQPQIMDTIEVRCPWLGVGRRRDTQWVPSQNVPVEVQKTWFEDVITASTELRKIALEGSGEHDPDEAEQARPRPTSPDLA